MVKRCLFMSFVVLGLVSVAGDSSAHFQAPPITGTAGNPLKLGPYYWSWASDGFVRRTGSVSTAPELEWIIPIQFHSDVPMFGNIWSVQIMASTGVRCSLQWRSTDITNPVQEGTLETTMTSPEGGRLNLTAAGLCPASGYTANCVTWFSTAWVSCWMPGGSRIGSVTATINPYTPVP